MNVKADETRKMVAIVTMRYHGRELEPGEAFNATEIDGRYYVLTDMARDAVCFQQAAPGESDHAVSR